RPGGRPPRRGGHPPEARRRPHRRRRAPRPRPTGQMTGGEADWPPGLAPLVSTPPLQGGFICGTGWGRRGAGRGVVLRRCPCRAEVEADGLAALAAAGAPVPAVLGVAGHVLVLEHAGGPPQWPARGG